MFSPDNIPGTITIVVIVVCGLFWFALVEWGNTYIFIDYKIKLDGTVYVIKLSSRYEMYNPKDNYVSSLDGGFVLCIRNMDNVDDINRYDLVYEIDDAYVLLLEIKNEEYNRYKDMDLSKVIVRSYKLLDEYPD